MGDSFLQAGIFFGKHLVGIVTQPYTTYRHIVREGRLGEVIYVWALLALYFAAASVIKAATFRPFFLTRQFVQLTGGAGASFLFAVAVLWASGKILSVQVNLRQIAVAWSYTLIPTLVWFLTTSILYVLLPPPRTTAPSGIAFSLVYLVFSTTMFLWKFVLYYLTVRFTMQLSFEKIMLVTGLVVVSFGFYAAVMYRLQIFRVPFL